MRHVLNGNTNLSVRNKCQCQRDSTSQKNFHRKMPRSKNGRTRQHLVDHDLLKDAVGEVLKGGSIRKAAKKYNLSKSTVAHYLKMNKNKNPETVTITRKVAPKKIFTHEEETMLYEYMEKAAYLHMGLTTGKSRSLAYDFAVGKQKTLPPGWVKEKMAGRQWLVEFRKRFPELSLRKPEATSLGRATAFNAHNVKAFYNNLSTVMQRYHYTPDRIYNLDETGNSTVHKPEKVLAPKGIRQLGKITSGERGTNITMIACINAVGNSVPPMIIFPRVYFKDTMMKGAPPGAIGTANPSGWSNGPTFQKYLEHFIAHVRPSIENPVLLLCDNHESHSSVSIIDIAKENGISIVTLHPHTSHKLQPLDRTVFGPFKNFYNKACDQWMMNNPGKPISLYEVAGLVGQTYPQAFTPNNIVKGFQVTGICPFNDSLFTEKDYLSAYVTDRPIPDSPTIPANTATTTATIVDTERIEHQEAASSAVLLSPENLRPFPKALARTQASRGRKKGKSRILTDTPEKNEILAAELQRNIKKERFTKKDKGKGKGKHKNLVAPLNFDEPSTSTSVKILTNDLVVSCQKCERVSVEKNLLKCDLCKKYVHIHCVSKKHKENVPGSDDEGIFVCEKCYVLSTESDASFDSEEMYNACRESLLK